MRTRSMLFGPANRLDFVPKFVASGTDIGVLDLEDAVAEADKDAARNDITNGRPGAGDLGTMALFVRVNSLDSGHFAQDLKATAAARAHGIIVPKIEDAAGVGEVRAAMARDGIEELALCAGIETAAGVHGAREIAAAHVDMVYFGAEDFITDMGGVRTESNHEVLYARSQVALAARLGGVPALDQVVTDFGDEERFEREAKEARAMGYAGKLCIHPAQVALALAAFSPSEEQLAWARGVLAAVEESGGSGVASFEGTMVDAPIITRAEALLAQVDD